MSWAVLFEKNNAVAGGAGSEILNKYSSKFRGMRWHSTLIAYNVFVALSIGSIPSHVMEALVDAKDGNTRPGQSHNMIRRALGIGNVWKCLVFPGVALTVTFFAPKIALMVDDLPTLG